MASPGSGAPRVKRCRYSPPLAGFMIYLLITCGFTISAFDKPVILPAPTHPVLSALSAFGNGAAWPLIAGFMLAEWARTNTRKAPERSEAR